MVTVKERLNVVFRIFFCFISFGFLGFKGLGFLGVRVYMCGKYKFTVVREVGAEQLRAPKVISLSKSCNFSNSTRVYTSTDPGKISPTIISILDFDQLQLSRAYGYSQDVEDTMCVT